ncbi:MAG: SPOR domain-containing protein [Campylobacteraceae bacterium]|jgi:DedD protein|nr:SPOR domain-containing protein [Campylobacteraceae bacterium]
MEEHELSDILLEQMNSKNSATVKIKRLLVIVVLLILLFIVVLMIMRFINKSDEQPQNTLTQSMLEESTNIQTITPITEENDSIIENIEENISSQAAEITQISPLITEAQNETQIEEPTIAPQPPVKTEENVKTPQPPIKTETSSNQAATPKGWYIQVSSAANAPAKSFLDGVSKKGYSYRLHKTTVNSKQVTKTLIGPYSSDKEARNALVNVKSDISKDAFLYQVK